MHTHSMKNGAHLYAVAAVVGHSDRQGLLDDRIQRGQEDLCSYLRQQEGEGSFALLYSALFSSAQSGFGAFLVGLGSHSLPM